MCCGSSAPNSKTPSAQPRCLWREHRLELLSPDHRLNSPLLTHAHSPLLVPQVQLLSWPLQVDADGRPILNTRGRSLYETNQDKTPCQATLKIPIDSRTSGINLPVPFGLDQSYMPGNLKNTAVAGILLTFKKPARPAQAAFVESVLMDGRVLYPKYDYSMYSSSWNGGWEDSKSGHGKSYGHGH